MGKRYDIDNLVTLPEASARLGLQPHTLNAYRAQGRGEWLPEPVKVVGRAALYDMRAIQKAYDANRGHS